MSVDVQDLIDDLVRREGVEFTNHPADRGGPTKYGITQKTLERWRSQPVTADDVAALTEAEARMIYHGIYVEQPGFDKVPNESLRALLVDSAVQHGEGDAIRWLQKTVAVTADGVLGPKTLERVQWMPAREVFAGVLAQRCAYYGALITNDPKRREAQKAGFRLQAENAHGWANRLAEFVRMTGVL